MIGLLIGKRFLLPVLALLLLLVTPLIADFSYSGSFEPSDFHFVSDAFCPGPILVVLPTDGAEQRGAVWQATKQQVATGFDTSFTIRLSDFVGGADGWAFVVQNESEDAIGYLGGAAGFAADIWASTGTPGITNSIAINWDGFANSESSDPNGNHLAIHTNGLGQNQANHAYALDTNTSVPDFRDANPHLVRVLYTPGLMQVFVDGTQYLSAAVDLATLLNLDEGRAWAAFTAGGHPPQGEVRATYDILNWFFQEQPGTGYNWIQNPANGHWYAATVPQQWQQAETEALSLGTHLVTIRNQQENDWLLQTFGHDHANYWIGFTDEAEEGNWVWTSGEPVVYTNWSVNEPNNSGNEDYAEVAGFAFSYAGQWNDYSTRTSAGIIELGGLPPGFALAVPTPGLAETVNIFTAIGGTPGRNVWFLYSTRRGSSDAPGCPGLAVGLLFAKFGGVAAADASGTATLVRRVPAKAHGRRVYIQAVDTGACQVSNLVSHDFP